MLGISPADGIYPFAGHCSGGGGSDQGERDVVLQTVAIADMSTDGGAVLTKVATAHADRKRVGTVMPTMVLGVSVLSLCAMSVSSTSLLLLLFFSYSCNFGGKTKLPQALPTRLLNFVFGSPTGIFTASGGRPTTR